jgi:hypothetical protein
MDRMATQIDYADYRECGRREDSFPLDDLTPERPIHDPAIGREERIADRRSHIRQTGRAH